jgi:hypothetical protein
MLSRDLVRINEVRAALRELTATPLSNRVATGVLPPEVAKPKTTPAAANPPRQAKPGSMR